MRILVDEIPIRVLAVQLDMDPEDPAVWERLRTALNSVTPHLRVDDAPTDHVEATRAAHQAWRDGRQDGWAKAMGAGNLWQWALGVAAQTKHNNGISDERRREQTLDEARWLTQQLKTPERAGVVSSDG